MKKSAALSKTFLLLATALFSLGSQAADFEWSGVYRIEGNHIQDSELDSHQRNLDYGLHHLSLRPKIVVGDGISVFGQFDLLTNNAYPDSQLGQAMGSGVGTATPASSDDSNAASSHQKSDFMRVSQLYLSWVHEYGSLIVGRAPLQFGLGITYSAGRGLFDHWFDTRDLVGYKVVIGNLYLLPMYGKVAETDLHKPDDVVDYMIQAQYENPETDLEMGAFYRVRKAGDSGSDWPTSADVGGLPGGANALPDSINMNELSVYALKDSDRFRLGAEGSFLSGRMGVVSAAPSSESVNLNGFGLAVEAEYRPEESRVSFGAKTGMATGDDPITDGRFEGFAFHRNYEVAMLLFNHPLGRRDVLRTRAFGGGPNMDSTASNYQEVDKPDVESLSNVVYLAPYLNYRMSEKFTLNGLLATGWLNVDPNTNPADENTKKDIGYEFDLGLSYSPRKGVVWKNEVGLVFPGKAWMFNDEQAGFAYGFTSKAAISF